MAELLRTPLHGLHLELGARMVPFAGYDMPVQYPLGVLKEHLHTRESAGLFDVSHMGQLLIEGEGAEAALETLIPVDLKGLPVNKQSYGLLCNTAGGILDDLIITRWGEDKFFVVINAACVNSDIPHIQAHLPANVSLNYMQGRGLLALQGPAAVAALAELAPDCRQLTFMTGAHMSVAGVMCYVTRSGYTGEDGFEISVPAESTEAIARKLLADDRVEAIGLGARDSLRLESGLCLYGHDLDTSTTPVEAGLWWSISPARREDGLRAGGFLGSDAIFAQRAAGVSRRRVGLQINGKAPVREGADIVNNSDEKVGVVTSGGFGPSVSAPVAMGYVAADAASLGTSLFALVRNKKIPVTVCKMPFVTQNYFRG